MSNSVGLSPTDVGLATSVEYFPWPSEASSPCYRTATSGGIYPPTLRLQNGRDPIRLSGVEGLGANTVRLPINPPSVSQSWWSSYRAAIDAARANGMKVILSAWTENNTVGTITDMSAWLSMWSTVVTQYGSNGGVYFEPLNEPYGYSLTQWVSICSSWLSAFPSVPRGRVIISGTGYHDHVTGVGAAAQLDGTLLSLHYYGTWNSYTQESSVGAPTSERLRAAGSPVRGCSVSPAVQIRAGRPGAALAPCSPGRSTPARAGPVHPRAPGRSPHR